MIMTTMSEKNKKTLRNLTLTLCLRYFNYLYYADQTVKSQVYGDFTWQPASKCYILLFQKCKMNNGTIVKGSCFQRPDHARAAVQVF